VTNVKTAVDVAGLSPQDAKKKRAAEYAVSLIEKNMKVGLGTGSTAKFAVLALARRVRDGCTACPLRKPPARSPSRRACRC
jgi:ribose 5-phosphate isomerase A